ncbi:MAG: DUF5615 family PIN-like protein [Candidatus Nanopelagicales bacterium]|nr:DUF5615 family PIN-like protein [Candidatus Nanopelagicales bacterium]
MSPGAPPVPLILDEMHQPIVAATLRQLGYDVLAVSEDPDLRSKTDEELFAWAVAEGRRIVTENIQDFRPLVLAAEASGGLSAGVIYTSRRKFPRSRQNPGPMIEALERWLTDPHAPTRPTEDWL